MSRMHPGSRRAFIVGSLMAPTSLLGGCNGSTVPSGASDSGARHDVTITFPSSDGGAGEGTHDAGIADAVSCFADGDLNNKCYTCEDTYCCPEQMTYAASDAGKAWVACRTACPQGDYPCRYNCDLTNSAGFAIVNSYLACNEKSCFGDCDEGEPDASIACAACLLSSCTEPYNACNASLGCTLYQDCGAACDAGDVVCQNNCLASVPASGPSLFKAVLACTYESCATACDDVTSCGLPVGTSTCAACQQAYCCAQATTCADDPVCAAIAKCAVGCTSPSCLSACPQGVDGGSASTAWQDLFQCEGNAGCSMCF